MQRSQIIPNIYGYAVCLIAILLFIASIAGLVSNIFRIADPSIGGMRGGSAMRFRTEGFGPPPFAAGAIRVFRAGPEGRGAAPNPRVFGGGPIRIQAPREMRDAMVARGRIAAVRSFVVDLVLIAVAVLLFGWHWRWLNEPQPV